jgi:beta-1,4-mannosyl-glycoprotein beta-1,4-N-acetylglucosaminyltransferase
MKLFDVFQFNNEIEILEIRLEYYYNVIDYFVITESNQTFFSEKKPFYFLNYQERLKKYKKKIVFNPINEVFEINKVVPKKKYFTDFNKSYDHKHYGRKLKDLSSQVKIEVYQRDSQILPLLNGFARKEDIIILGDIDEFTRIEILREIKNKKKIIPPNQHLNIGMNFFIYNINFMAKEPWYGTRIFAFKTLNEGNKSLDLMRYHLTNKNLQKFEVLENSGWHFSKFGSIKLIKQQLRDQNFNGKKIAPILKIFYKIFNNLLQNKVNKGQDVINRANFYKINPVKYLPKQLVNLFKKFMR